MALDFMLLLRTIQLIFEEAATLIGKWNKRGLGLLGPLRLALQSASFFVRRRKLQILELDENVRTGDCRECLRIRTRRCYNMAIDPSGGRGDVVDCDSGIRQCEVGRRR